MRWFTAKEIHYRSYAGRCVAGLANLRAYYGWMWAFPGRRNCWLWE
ncbi:hypothetical protein KCP76_07905 [Salmonella enterica subsp. enterica serovar Weltevreden]|nr:hypothetical protein KCP76_07905 [Salmonella enterica subsp. enterica serovar Weltevreden]